MHAYIFIYVADYRRAVKDTKKREREKDTDSQLFFALEIKIMRAYLAFHFLLFNALYPKICRPSIPWSGVESLNFLLILLKLSR